MKPETPVDRKKPSVNWLRVASRISGLLGVSLLISAVSALARTQTFEVATFIAIGLILGGISVCLLVKRGDYEN